MNTLDHLATRMARLARRRTLLISGVVTVPLAIVLFASSGTSSLAAVADRCGAPAPDVRFTTSPEGIQSFLAGCGAAGRSAYRDLQLLDLLYPAAFGLFLATAMALLVPLAWRGGSPRWRAVAAIPLLGAAFDYVENAAAWTLLVRYPEPATWVARILGTASAAKQTTMWASALLVLAGLGGAAVERARQRRKPKMPWGRFVAPPP